MNIVSIKRKLRKSRMWKEDAFVVAILAISISYLIGVDVLYGVAMALANIMAFVFIILIVYGPTIATGAMLFIFVFVLCKL